jgi:hypothetical protein
MSTSSTHAAKLLWLAALAAPVVVVQAVGMLAATGPQSANAAPVAATPAGLPMSAGGAAPVLTPSQKAAVEWLAAHRGMPVTRSPLTPGRAPEPEPTPPPAPRNEPIRDAKPPEVEPVIELSTILRSGLQSAAVINGKTFRLGQEVVAGWRFIGVDPRRSAIVLRHTDGRVRVISDEPTN